MENPDVEGYVRRSGRRWACSPRRPTRATSRCRCARPRTTRSACSPSPCGRRWSKLEEELKKQGKELDEKEIANIRKKYRRRSTQDVMDEIDDEIKDHFSEHQLQHELVQIMQDELGDLSGSGQADRDPHLRPGPERAAPARRGGRRQARREGHGPRPEGDRQQRLRGQRRPADHGGPAGGRPSGPDAGGGAAADGGDVPGPDRGPGAGVVAAHHRRPRPLPRRAALRPRLVRPGRWRCSSGCCLPEGKAPPPGRAAGAGAVRAAVRRGPDGARRARR